jgi:hypothetical protein
MHVAIDPIANANVVLARFDVDIARAEPDGMGEDLINDGYNGPRLDFGQDGLGVALIRSPEFADGLSHEGFELVLARIESRYVGEKIFNPLWNRKNRFNAHARHVPDELDGLDVERVLHRDANEIAAALNANEPMRAANFNRNFPNGGRLGRIAGEIPTRNTQMGRPAPNERRFANESMFEQKPPQWPMLNLLQSQCVGQLLPRDKPLGDQRLSKMLCMWSHPLNLVPFGYWLSPNMSVS